MIFSILSVAILLVFAGAIYLFVYAARRARSEDVLLRLRAGDDEAAATVVTEGQIYNPIVRAVCHLLWRAGSQAKAAQVATSLMVLVALVPLTLLIFGWLQGAVIIFFAGLMGWFVLNRRAASRRARIVEQLPAYLEAAMRVLAAGNTLEEAIASAAREAQDPLRSLFISVARQVRLGAPVDTVLAEAAEIHQIRDLRVLALAANINRKYGGTLRNVFRSLIQAIRMREAAARELRALTAETRFSAFVLAAIPIAVSAFIFFRNRAYYVDILATPSGKTVLISAVVLQLLGMLVIWRMMQAASDTEA
ncbi:MAG: Tight adherence protein [Hydrocarboniphaga sp.]|uniref:type II secretion system F family protein n=1 Tax=Hydrocarboniphaga sp. TaxID=2033016 RepID=UPI0026088A67|nr:type II secretion system F family protein [Hydrocarboniphaga sp.]MDB5972403.1 Tight adherence protein [Hydrocarboniphaga sp.]